jgi:3-isopropylmalate/(R)-2-methylmalate dehydratase small subunit
MTTGAGLSRHSRQKRKQKNMKAVHIVQGTAVPLDRTDVDTDQIIPSDWLKRVERTGFEKGLFSEWRDDRNFVLNQEQYSGANILIGGLNFGTGSSREHAVWAIQQYGFDAVISPRFADIFRNNCTKNGLVPAAIDADICETLMRAVEADPTLEITVDVARLTVEAPAIGLETSFPMDAATQDRFLEGLDDIGLTMRVVADIDDYETHRRAWMPSQV